MPGLRMRSKLDSDFSQGQNFLFSTFSEELSFPVEKMVVTVRSHIHCLIAPTSVPELNLRAFTWSEMGCVLNSELITISWGADFPWV